MSNQVFSFGFNGIKNYTLPEADGFRSLSSAEATFASQAITDFSVSKELVYFSFGSGNSHLFFSGQFEYADLPAPTTIRDVFTLVSGEFHSAVYTDLSSAYKGTTVYKLDDSIPLSISDLGHYNIDRQEFVYRGDDTFWASKDADTMFGFDGDDLFYANFDRLAGRPDEDDVIFGGDGEDRVIFSGNMADYTLSAGTLDLSDYLPLGSDENAIVVNQSSNPSESTTLHSVEFIEFKDYTVSYAENSHTLFRLYQGAFDRLPDAAGLGYWLAELENGLEIHEIAEAFLFSSEFEMNYGADLDHIGYIHALYANVLKRTPDVEGLSYWLDELLTNSEVDRAGMLVSFSESAENIANTDPLIELGVVYQPYGDVLT